MPGDPRECRRHALRCAELAVSAGPQRLKAALPELSKNWEQLAIELENGSAMLGAILRDDVLRLAPFGLEDRDQHPICFSDS